MSQLIPLKSIRVDPERNCRTSVGQVDDLAASIKRDGLLQPVGVVKDGDSYELVYGYRRMAALQKLGQEFVPAEVVETMSEADRSIRNLAENMARADLTPYEQARALSTLQEAHDLSGAVIAARVGKSPSYVNNLIRIYRGLAPVVIERWQEESTPGFGVNSETGKKDPEAIAVCQTDWLGKLVGKVPKDQHAHELGVALGEIEVPVDDGEDGDVSGDGEGNEDADDSNTSPMGPDRVSAKVLKDMISQLGRELKAAEGEFADEIKSALAALKWAAGKSQAIRLGHGKIVPGDEVASEPKAKKAKKAK